MVTYPSLISFW